MIGSPKCMTCTDDQDDVLHNQIDLYKQHNIVPLDDLAVFSTALFAFEIQILFDYLIKITSMYIVIIYPG